MEEGNEYEFDEETIDFLIKATAINNLLAKAIPIMEKLNNAELALLDRLTPTKGLLSNEKPFTRGVKS